MLAWLRRLFRSSDNDQSGERSRVVNAELLILFRNELKECESLYRTGAKDCIEHCPEKIRRDHSAFLELMVDLLAEESRYVGVAFDSILVDAPARLQKEWRRLADATGGRSIAVQFDAPAKGAPKKSSGGASDSGH